MSTLRRLLPALGAAFLLLAAPAAAAPRAVPPGHSGASQYTETLPSAGGETPTAEIPHGSPSGGPGAGGGNSSGGGGGTSGGATGGEAQGGAAAATAAEALGSQNAKRLEKLGPEGKAAAGLAAAGGTAAKQAAGNEAAAPDHASASSPVKQVVGELTGTSDSGGMGLLLPLLIGMTVLVAGAFLVTRRRPVGPRD